MPANDPNPHLLIFVGSVKLDQNLVNMQLYERIEFRIEYSSGYMGV